MRGCIVQFLVTIARPVVSADQVIEITHSPVNSL